MKTCTRCGEAKPLTDFWRDRSKKHGYGARCKPCKVALQNEYRRRTGYDHRRYWRDPVSERERHLVRKYGVSLAAYDEMFKRQGNFILKILSLSLFLFELLAFLIHSA